MDEIVYRFDYDDDERNRHDFTLRFETEEDALRFINNLWFSKPEVRSWEKVQTTDKEH